MMRYEQIVRDFVSSIGTQAQAPLEALTTDIILQFKERWLSGGRSPRTVNQTIKILKRPFKIALEQGLIDRNPVAAVRPIRTSSAKKGVFSPEQIRRLLEVTEGDWKGLILCGYFTVAGSLTLRDLLGATPIYKRRQSPSCRERPGLLFKFQSIRICTNISPNRVDPIVRKNRFSPSFSISGAPGNRGLARHSRD
jgi:hypothetical protein